MVTSFKNDEKGYLRWVHENPQGYVYNDSDGINPQCKKLHKSNCKALHNVRPDRKRTSVKKICCSNFLDLCEWITTNRGPEPKGYTLCGVCLPFSNATLTVPKKMSSNVTSTTY